MCHPFKHAAMSIIALVVASSTLAAQRLTTARTASSSSVVINGQGTSAPVRAEVAQPAPGSLTNDALLALAKLTLGAQWNVFGVGAKARLTPAQPLLPDRAALRVANALSVDPDASGGQITLQPDVVSGSPQVSVEFRPSVANRPVFVDFVLKVSTVNAPVGISIAGHGVKEQRTLGAGDHHVTAIVLPNDLGWYTVSLAVANTSKYQRVWVYAVEVATLQ